MRIIDSGLHDHSTRRRRLARLRFPPVPWRSPKFWLIQTGVLAAMSFHLILVRVLRGQDVAGIPAPLTSSLMLIPVLYAALAFGAVGAVATATWATTLFTLHWIVLHTLPVTSSHLWIELVNTVVLIASGVIVGQRVGKEQAARRRTESALRVAAVAEARYRGLFEDQPSPVIVTDARGTVIEVNSAARTLLGPGSVGQALRAGLGLTIAELRASQSPVAIRSIAGPPRSYVPGAHEIDAGDGTALVQIVLADVTDECLRQDEQRAFAKQLLSVQEEERLRLARELHDDPLQQLMYLTRILDDVAHDDRLAAGLVDRVRNGQRSAESAAVALSGLIHGLRPPVLDDLGLLPALRQLLDDVRRRGNLEVQLRVVGHEARLDPELELTAFRIVQEALNNVVRHADAAAASVTVGYGDDLVLDIRDHGKGMPQTERPEPHARRGLGLTGVRERVAHSGGSIQITSDSGRGTTVHVSIPSRYASTTDNAESVAHQSDLAELIPTEHQR